MHKQASHTDERVDVVARLVFRILAANHFSDAVVVDSVWTTFTSETVTVNSDTEEGKAMNAKLTACQE